MKRSMFALGVALVTSAIVLADSHSVSPSGDPNFSAMADEIEGLYENQVRAGVPHVMETPSAPAGSGSSRALPSGSTINTMMAGARNASDWFDAGNLLDRAIDENYDLDFAAGGTPEVPATLCGTSENCTACYEHALNQLSDMRFNLESLRVLGKGTSDYVSKSLALGDGLSGSTSVAALEWQKQRGEILQGFEKFKKDYDTKYQGMMKGLKTAMDSWSSCEGEFGERDWYARFGFLYYQFMQDKYKRNF